MEKSYKGSGSFLNSFNWPVLLVISMLVFVFANAAIGQSDGQSVITVPSMKDNVVTMDAGGMLSITVPNTLTNQQYRIQRTFPSDRSSLTVTSNGGDLVIPPIQVSSAGEQVISILGLGENQFAYSFKITVSGIIVNKSNVPNLFSNQGNGLLAPTATEYLDITPAPTAGVVNICSGGKVIVTVKNSINLHQYYMVRTTPQNGPKRYVTGNGGDAVFDLITPDDGATQWTVSDIDISGTFATIFDVLAVPDPIAPVLNKIPDQTSVCDGDKVKATLNTAGSGGVAGCVPSYQYRTNSGTWSAWGTYVLNTDIGTSGLTGVEIRAIQSHPDGLGCYAENVYSWTVTKITLTTSSTQTTCPSHNNGTATVTASGGTGPYSYNWGGYILGPLEFQNGWDGGIVNGSPVGFTNTGPGDADVVNTVTHNGTQSWYFKHGYGSPGAGTPFTPVIATVGALSQGTAGNQSIITLSFKAAVPGDGSLVTVYEGAVNRDDRTGANLYLLTNNYGSGYVVRLYTYEADPTLDFGPQYVIGDFDAAVWHTVQMITDYPTPISGNYTTWGTTQFWVDGILLATKTTWPHWYRNFHSNPYTPGSSIKFNNYATAVNGQNGFYIDDVSMIVNNTVTSLTVGSFSTGFEPGVGQTTASISNLTPGPYPVVVTDINGCKAYANVMVTKNPAGPVHNMNSGLNYCQIQPAIDAATPGDVIEVDAGNYPENVLVNKRLQIIGTMNPYYAPATFINPASGNAITISVDGIAPGGTGNSLEIQNVYCVGDPGNLFAHEYGILVTVPVYYLNLYNVYADNFRYAGLQFNGTNTTSPAKINIWDCQFQGCDNGINLGLGMVGDGINGIYIRSGLIKNNRYVGLTCTGSDGGQILSNITVEGVQFGDNGTGGLALSTYASDIFLQRFNGNALIKGLTFSTNAATAIDLRGKGNLHVPTGPAGNVQIQDCHITGTYLDANRYNKDVIKIRNYTDISNVQFIAGSTNEIFTRNDPDATGLRFEDISAPSGTYTLSNISFPNAYLGYGHGTDIANLTAMNIDATSGVTFGGSPSNFTIEDRIVHKIDYAPLGLVTWVANNDYVTVNSYFSPLSTKPLIQRGVDAAGTPGWTVNIGIGLYKESNIAVNKPLTVLGESKTGVIIAPDVADDHNNSSFGGNYRYCFLLGSGNVIISTLTIDGNGNGSLGGNHNFRAGVMTDHRLVTMFNNITVQDVIVQHTNRRGIQLFSGMPTNSTGHLVTGCTLNDVTIGPAIVVYDGDANITDNIISNVPTGSGIEVVQNMAPGSINSFIRGNTITNVWTGIQTVWASSTSVIGGPAPADKNIINQAGGAVDDIGIILRNADPGATVQNNDVTGSARDAGIWMYDDGSVSSPVLIKDNTLIATGSTSPYWGYANGIFMTDDGNDFFTLGNANLASYATITGNTISGFETGIGILAYGSPPLAIVSATIGNNKITGGSTGVYLYDNDGATGGYSAQATIHENDLSGNTVYGVDAGVSPHDATADATCNWWGFLCNSDVLLERTTYVTYIKWLVDGTNLAPPAPGFIPVSGTCTGEPEIVSEVELQSNTTGVAPWTALAGTLGGGYTMCLDASVPFYYLDINTLTSSLALQTGTLNPFTVTAGNAILIAYWAGLGLTADPGGNGWAHHMWLIINGSEPIFYILFDGTDYRLIDGLQYLADDAHLLNPLRVNGDYPQGTYTYTGKVTDVTNCLSANINVNMTFSTIPVVTDVSMQSNITGTPPWNAVSGTLGTGYNMCLDASIPFYYLDINTLASSVTLQTGTMNPFSLPAGGNATLIAYWAGKGLTADPGGNGWAHWMWLIIHGDAPLFYIVYDGTDYKLIDALQYLADGAHLLNPLRVNGDYPQGTYTYLGTVLGNTGCTSAQITVTMTFSTIPAVTDVSMQSNITGTPPWNAVSGTLGTGYNMCLDASIPFYYLDINTLASSVPLNIGTMNPFSLPAGGNATLIAYWAGKGLTADPGGNGWAHWMWLIIHGNAPLFYIVYDGADYKLIDALQYLADDAHLLNPLRVNGDYPQGTYTYIGTVLGNNGCTSAQISVNMTFYTIPTATISGSQAVCSGTTATLSVALTGSPNWDITWYDGTTYHPETGISTSPYLIYVNPTANTTYTVTSVSNGTPCTGIASGSATVYIGPITTAKPYITACQNTDVAIPLAVSNFKHVGNVSLTLHYNDNVMTYYGFDNNSGLFTGGVADVFATVDPSTHIGTIRISYVCTLANPYKDLNDGDPLLTLKFHYHSGNNDLTFDDSEDGMCEYTSGYPDQLPFCDDPTTTYYINGKVSEKAAAIVYAGPDQTICAGSAATLAGSITGGASAGIWSVGTGNYVPGNTSLTAAYTPSAAEIIAGSVTLTLTSTNALCTDFSDNVKININPYPMISFGFNGEEAGHNATFGYCHGTSVKVTLYQIYAGTGPFTVAYNLDNIPQTPVTVTVPGSILATQTLADGTHTIVVTDITDGNGCHASAEFLTWCVATIYIYPVPVASASVTTPIPCNGGTATVTITATVGTAPFSYTFNGVTNGTGVFTDIPAGINYPWSVTDVHNCGSASGSINVTQPAAISVSGYFNYYSSNTPLCNVKVELWGGGVKSYPPLLDPDVTTNLSGQFTFGNVCPGTYEVRATSTQPVGNINSTDAGLVNAWPSRPCPVPGTIQKVQFYAGDVAGNDLGELPNNYINGYDAQRIKGYFVSGGALAFDRLPWAFWKVGETICHNPPDPYVGYQYPTITVSSGYSAENFYGECTGDFNHLFVPSCSKEADAEVSAVQLISDGTIQVGAGTEFDLPLRAVSSMELGAVSLVLNFPSDIVEVMGVTLKNGDRELDWAVSGDELRIGWYSMTPLSVATAEDLITLRLKTSDKFSHGQTIRLSLVPTSLNDLADASYTGIPGAALSVDNVEYSPIGINEHGAKDLTFQNHPNPFGTYTIFTYTLPVDGKVTIEITSLLGQVVKTLVNQQQTSGKYSLKMDADWMPQGVYTATLKLDSSDGKLMRTVKLVVYR